MIVDNLILKLIALACLVAYLTSCEWAGSTKQDLPFREISVNDFADLGIECAYYDGGLDKMVYLAPNDRHAQPKGGYDVIFRILADSIASLDDSEKESCHLPVMFLIDVLVEEDGVATVFGVVKRSGLDSSPCEEWKSKVSNVFSKAIQWSPAVNDSIPVACRVMIPLRLE